MGFFRRVSDIISANLNEFLDRCEDPEKMLKQMIRDMEETIAESRRGVAKAIAAEKLLRRELDANRKQVEVWEEKAEKAVEAGKDDLARAALARKKEHASLVASLSEQWNRSKATTESLKKDLRALEAKVAEARRKKDSLIARQRAAQASRQIQASMGSVGEGTSAAFTKFERLEDKVEMLEAQAEAVGELGSDRRAIEDAFKELDKEENDIESELAALKSRVGSAGVAGSERR